MLMCVSLRLRVSQHFTTALAASQVVRLKDDKPELKWFDIGGWVGIPAQGEEQIGGHDVHPSSLRLAPALTLEA